MRERPILFSGAMVRAIMAGKKTQTRRVFRDSVSSDCCGFRDWGDGMWSQMFRYKDEPEALPKSWTHKSPYGEPGDGDVLWVRETWRIGCDYWTPHGNWKDGAAAEIQFQADDKRKCMPCNREQLQWWHQKRRPGWKPSIHMPRWASRLTLLVEDVRVERVQEISDGDAIAEGISKTRLGLYEVGNPCGGMFRCTKPRDVFMQLWDSINAKRGYGWKENPWVWVVTFSVIEQEAR